MLRPNGEETEILLGNTQLLGIFFVVAILLGIAFTGGYMVGRGSSEKKPAGPVSTEESSPTKAGSNTATGGETHSIPAEAGTSPDQVTAAHPQGGQPHSLKPEQPAQAPDANFAPASGQEFLQVAAVGRDEAEAVADVLHKKGFRAHAVPKPGNGTIYRVLIGPIRDAGDLSSTRDALRRTGFREVIVQHY